MALNRIRSAVARWARVLVYFVSMLVVCLYCEVIGRVWSLWLAPEGSEARVRRANRVTRHWNVVLTELTLRLLQARLEVRGTIPTGRFVVVSNHQSTADVAILPWALRSLNLKFVAKEQLGHYIPTVSMALMHWGSALISREATRQDFTRLKLMARRLEYWDGSVVVFPEGTRSRDGELLPYKAAAVRIVAQESGLPILPVAIDGTHVASDLAGFARRMFGARGTLTIGTTIPPEVWKGRIEDVVQEIRAWAADTIQEGRRDESTTGTGLGRPKTGLLHGASMRRAVPIVFAAAACLASPAATVTAPLDQDIQAVAALPGEPRSVSAAGITRAETPLSTLENPSAFDPAVPKFRLVIVGGLDGDERSAKAALAAVKWMKSGAPKATRDRWVVSALPMADPDGHARAHPYRFPPVKGFYEDAEQPESRYVWRWVAYQAPDLVVEIRGDAQDDTAPDSLTMALRDEHAAGLGPTATAVLRASAPAADLGKILAGVRQRSPLHEAIAQRIARAPLNIARLLASRYPAAPAISYIPALAWINTLKLADRTGEEALRARVLAQIQPWLLGVKPLLGDRIQLTTVAGTMVFAELAKADPANDAARRLAIEGADAALEEKAGGVPQYGQGWTDDMFMASAILARTAAMDGRARDLDRSAQLLTSYAGRLQQPDGIFNHATDGPAAWGRGNGFAAFGLIETLTAMPADHPSRAALLDIFTKQMRGLAKWQAPDGMWREIVDRPGAYREETATAMILTAMARGVRLGWLDRSYAPVVDRAWRALAAHIVEDGGLVDVCSGTGAGPTARYYFDRPAIEGPDDRGGAMALVAAMERLATR